MTPEALIEDRPYRVEIAGVRTAHGNEEQARAYALSQIEAWIALGYRSRTAKVSYRDGTLIAELTAADLQPPKGK